MSAPTPDHHEADALLERLSVHQRASSLSAASLVRLLPELGSARSWRRLCARDWAEMPLDVWLPKLRTAAKRLATGARAAESPDVPVGAVMRHLHEAEHCHRTGQLALARGHCRAARTAIEAWQRTFSP